MVFGKYIYKYYIKYALPLLAGLFALILVDYLQLTIPNYYQQVLNGINNGYVVVGTQTLVFDMEYLLERICRPMVITIFLIVFGRFLWRVTIFGAATKMEADLRGRMFDHCELLSQEYYHKNKTGDMMSLFTNDLDTVQECFGWGYLQFFDALILGGMAVYKMFRMNPYLTLFSMIPMGFLFAAGSVLMVHLGNKWEYRQECFSELTDFAQESFSGLAVVKAFVKESLRLASFDGINRKNEDANVDFTKLAVLMRVLLMAFVESVICVILGYGGYLVFRGNLNAGQLMEFMGYFNAVIWPIMAISELLDMTSRGRASMKRISELLDEVPTVKDARELNDPGDLEGTVEFRNLSFRYPDTDRDVLKNISFSIAPGEKVGLAGATGCGKSTLVELILRIYNVEAGSLFIGGYDVNTIPIEAARRTCAYVPQDNFLFSDTIENNISFGSGAGITEVENAAKKARVHENIMGFADGYSTVLWERGVTVSGGQKQRIAMSRALIKKAPILILDDSLSAVDTDTEKGILDNLFSEDSSGTLILICHRMSTMERMDKILFMEDGMLSDCGRHQDLYARNEAYRKMVDLQNLEHEGS